MHFRALSLVALCLLGLSSATLQNVIDLKRLEGILQSGTSSDDLATLYYSVKGLHLLKSKMPDVCQTIKQAKYDLNDIEQVFYLTNAASLSGCVNYLKPDILSASTRVLDKKDAALADVYHAIYTQKALGKGAVWNKDEGLKNLISILKKNDTPLNYGYVFALCEHMGCESWTASQAEALLLAADESDSRALHFEGGLPVTSLVLSTIIRSYKALKKATPLTEQQRYKFAEYLLSRRSVTSQRGATLLLEAALALADDEPAPITIMIKGKKYITSDSDTIQISVSDFVGRPIRGLKPEEVVAQSGTRLADDVVVLSKQPLTQSDQTTFVLNLSKIKSQYGMYKIALSAGSRTSNVNVAVLGEIQVSSIEVGVGDVDGTTSPKVTTVEYPNKLNEILHADHMQKVTLKFTVRDKQNKPVLVQQAFVVVAPKESGNTVDEAIFVAEPDNSKAYKVELNVGAISKHLQSGSGTYSLTVLLGDSAVSNPISWQVGHVGFNFGKDATAVGAPVKSSRSSIRGLLPEIEHMFRVAEPRPPRAVSDVFALLCAAPLLLLLGLWAKLRVNLGYFPFTPSALVFHLALGASLALYGVLWVKLTMFETVRYLLPLGAVTFLSGHRLLRRLVQDKGHK